MSIHGSALADADLVDAIEDVMCRVCAHAPTYAVDLVQHAGRSHAFCTLLVVVAVCLNYHTEQQVQ